MLSYKHANKAKLHKIYFVTKQTIIPFHLLITKVLNKHKKEWPYQFKDDKETCNKVITYVPIYLVVKMMLIYLYLTFFRCHNILISSKILIRYTHSSLVLVIYGVYFASTVECHYNVIQYNMILHASLWWLSQNIHKNFNLQKTPLTDELWDVFREDFRENSLRYKGTAM